VIRTEHAPLSLKRFLFQICRFNVPAAVCEHVTKIHHRSERVQVILAEDAPTGLQQLTVELLSFSRISMP
jgi:hypothetical protein